jgi:hypothetical protein
MSLQLRKAIQQVAPILRGMASHHCAHGLQSPEGLEGLLGSAHLGCLGDGVLRLILEAGHMPTGLQ